MSEAQTPPNAETEKWSAATAKDCIAIVTTDAKFEAYIREVLRDEPYEIVAVASFEPYQGKIDGTLMGIVRLGRKFNHSDLCRVLDKDRAYRYPVLAIWSKDYTKRWRENYAINFMQEYNLYPIYDIHYPAHAVEIICFTRVMVRGARTEAEG